ncbi:MAG: TIGR03915 family putative DNA repair protein, partial [Oscillospiraceae bacterium]|nr:TIGR03915 family putative DNA repair protein [Oscillospiraceae bacterium]
LLRECFIGTDVEKAKRVRESVVTRISPRSLELIETVFLSCLEGKELKILRYLLLGYSEGAKIDNMLGHADVSPLLAAERHLLGESHLLTGFIRFSDYDGVLAAAISPKNYVLPSLTKHFVERFNTESFMIYDKTHKCALFYEQGKAEILPVEHINFPAPSEREQGYRELWKRFYKTIAIEARENPRCRRTHLPKRYWSNMTEMAELL